MEDINGNTTSNEENSTSNEQNQNMEVNTEYISPKMENHKMEVNNSFESSKSDEVKAETVEISKDAEKRVLSHVEPRQIKINRFRFKNESDKLKLIELIKNTVGNNITVKIDTNDNNLDTKPDIILEENGSIVGVINLLLCNHSDINLPDKYYIKLYFRDFKDNTLYNNLKNSLVDFFEKFQSENKAPVNTVQGGVKRTKRAPHKTHKKRKHIQIKRNKKITKRNKKSLKRR